MPSTTEAITVGSVQITGGVLASSAATGAIWSAAAVPIIGAAVAGVTLALSLWFNRKGPQQKTLTTQIVNEMEPYMVQNRDAFLSGPRTVSSQVQALNNFDAMWAEVVKQCSNPQLGNPGKACIEDRQRGGMWDWFSYYRDPIQSAAVTPDPALSSEASSALEEAFSTISLPSGSSVLLLGAAGLLAVAAVLGGGGSRRGRQG